MKKGIEQIGQEAGTSAFMTGRLDPATQTATNTATLTTQVDATLTLMNNFFPGLPGLLNPPETAF